MKRALITGISGQDGSYLAGILLKKGYKIIGGTRNPKSSPFRLSKLGILSQVELVSLSMDNETEIFHCIEEYRPDEIYNLAAQSSVQSSFDYPLDTAKVDAFGVAYLLEAIRKHSPNSRYFQASSSEIFGNIKCESENLPISPSNPYSIAKSYAHLLTLNYRKIYHLHTVLGILFNHDSELRGEHFFTKKISHHVAKYHRGDKSILRVGNIYASRDIGYAPEYALAMYLSLQYKNPEDFIISTGKTEIIKNFINYCFESISINIQWRGEGEDERGFHSITGELLIEVDKEKFRPSDIPVQESNPEKIYNLLGWKSQKNLREIAEIMVKAEILELES